MRQFRKVTRMPATSATGRLVDLAWMAIVGLFHETDVYVEAAEAYSHVNRGSPSSRRCCSTSSLGYTCGSVISSDQRALEVLTITNPNNLELADGSAAARRFDAARG